MEDRRSCAEHASGLCSEASPASRGGRAPLALVETRSPRVARRSYLDEIWLPDFVESSLSGKDNLRRRPKHEVRDHDYLNINPRFASGRMHNALIFDIDCNNGVAAFLELLEDTGIHFSMLVGLPTSSSDLLADLGQGGFGQYGLKRLHATILLKRGVSENDRRAFHLLQVIHRCISDRLRQYGATVDAGQKVSTKNPESARWSVISGTWKKTSLYELAARLELDIDEYKKTPRAFRGMLSGRGNAVQQEADAIGRNCGAFEACRWIAYRSWSSFRSEARFIDFMIEQVEAYNRIHNSDNPLPISECKSIACSIARWTWKHQPDPAGQKRRGAAAEYIASEDPLPRRQAIGALYTNATQVRTNARKVWEAKKQIVADGRTPTKKEVARITGLAVNTVRAHWAGHTSTSSRRLEALRQGAYVILPSDHRQRPSEASEVVAAKGCRMVTSEIGLIEPSPETTEPIHGEPGLRNTERAASEVSRESNIISFGRYHLLPGAENTSQKAAKPLRASVSDGSPPSGERAPPR